MTLNEPSEIRERWRQYFQNLLKDPNITGMEITEELGEELEKDTERTEEQGGKKMNPQQLMMVGKTQWARIAQSV